VSVYSYFSTDITTGALLMANIPAEVQTFSTQISGTGQLSGTLTLRSDMKPDFQLQALNALEPWKAMFWVLCDNIPVWGGPVTTWYSDSAQDLTLSFTAATIDSVLAYRIYDVNTNFVAQDVGLIFYETLNYVMGKKLPNSRIANLAYSNTSLNVSNTTFSVDANQYEDVQSIWNALVTDCDVEYYFQPSWSGPGSNTPQLKLMLGQTVGRPWADTNLNLVYPSPQVVDYSYIQQSANVANHIIATGNTDASTPVFYESSTSSGYDYVSLGQDHTLLEQSYSMPNAIVGQSDVDAAANALVQTLTPASQLTPDIYLGPDAFPRPYDVQIGDGLYFSATSYLHPPKQPGGPGLVCSGRVTNVTVYPPSADQTQVEQTQLTLGGITVIV
jgi:hypothetical protein